MTKIKFLIFFFLLQITAFAQTKPVATSVDTLKNKIGAQFNLTIKVTADADAKIIFPSSNRFGALEVIRSYEIDTVKTDSKYEFVKRYGITQFDSGRYTIPQLPLMINKKGFMSDSISIEISNVQVDTLKQKMFEIKDIDKSEQESSIWWKFLLVVLVIAAIVAAVWYFLKNKKHTVEEEIIYKTPIEKATTLLAQLEKKELWQKGQIKSYYSELTDIARIYIEEAIKIPAMESTTSELIAGLQSATLRKHINISPETVQNLESVLMQADLVKFAKSKPLDYEIAEDRKKISSTIVTLDKSIPEEIEEEKLVEIDNSAEIAEKNKRASQIKWAIGSVVGLIVVVLAFFIATTGFENVKDTVLRNPNKILLERTWVNSEYGNPGVLIETPKVLLRMKNDPTMPKESVAMLQDFQSFSDGTIGDGFYVNVATKRFKEETKVDLNEAVNGLVDLLEKQGVQNMLVKQESFDTKQGIVGVKASGTFYMGNSSTKQYYEILLFGQDNGLQQVVITHDDEDKYAKEISEKILNSVELKKAAK
ncbi:hypothetical protein [Flavobacterium ardleyense]|uniref:hypothetical protein n=1 Tax=Flavobacterium ardleyense TaxID=2038737 RepID=UPI00298C08BD|nr:hypothetical protein [Flavobacterium ardleyense]